MREGREGEGLSSGEGEAFAREGREGDGERGAGGEGRWSPGESVAG